MIVDQEMREANSFSLAVHQIQDASRYLDAFIELLDAEVGGQQRYFDHCEAIFIAVVVAYARPFKKSKSNGRADKFLSPAQVGLDARPELAATHQQLMASRDELIAHSDWTHHRTQLTSVGETGVLRHTPRPKIVDRNLAMKLPELFEYVSQQCIKEAIERDRRSPLCNVPTP